MIKRVPGRWFEINSMVPRASKLDIYAAVLTEIKNGTPIPTKIIYGDTPSWMTLKNILETLTAKGFIAEQLDKETKNGYNITEKGTNVLNYLTNLNESIEPKLTH
ncbi:unnamed protein product [marine sediment metagenome]|uniref:ArnR1-like winged helix-turn-helix domain-containing protein n=1 Tax=marine sediment metagenome TaxID=412755 RepID=X1D1J5_9ZZZZ